MTQEQLRFDGRVALVTGAGRGMGKVHAEFLASRGAVVVVSDRGTAADGLGSDLSVASDVAAGIEAAGGKASAYTADLSAEEGARGAVRHALSQHGRLDIIVHNAGIARSTPFEHSVIDNLDALWAVNTRAAALMIEEAWPAMTTAGYGRIVVIGSTAMYGLGDAAYYATAKASYLGLVRSVAEAGRAVGVKANLVGPSGATRLAETMEESEFKDWFFRTMRNELVTALVAYLAHERCAVTGETFAAAGGRVARVMIGENRGIVDAELTAEKMECLINDIMTDGSFEPFPDYVSSAATLMQALGYAPATPMTSLSFSKAD